MQNRFSMNDQPLPCRFESICEPAPEMREVVNTELRQLNPAANPLSCEALSRLEYSATALNIFVFDQGDKFVAGCLPKHASCGYRFQLWRSEVSYEAKGTGTELMSRAKAIQRDCRDAFVDNMEYQAPDFHLSLGFRVAGQLKN
jgi:hypothetical protein